MVLSYTWLLCRCRWPVLILSSRKGIGLPHHTLESIAFIFSLLYFLWLSLCNQRVFFGKFFILCCLQGAPQQGTMCILLESYDLFFGSRLFCVVLLIWRIHKVYCWHLLHCTTVFLLIFVGVLSGQIVIDLYDNPAHNQSLYKISRKSLRQTKIETFASY